ncbi:hypothetical protein EV209_2807 [Cuneatibacter caecimuris]|uniref:Uncharacterized protein n=1 Tax=Cuneatibacter caecimuris TaxID=1796618 RepID=A0A4V2F5G5_9FIRM|nr:hypothetical protein EV209_2807 [Cuneatibacter caecimuris]
MIDDISQASEMFGALADVRSTVLSTWSRKYSKKI